MSIQIVNPSNQKVIAEYQYLPLNAAFEKIQILAGHLEKWRLKSVSERAVVVKKIAGNLRANKEKLARQATLEMGKPITQALGEVEKCAGALETLANLAVENLKSREVAAQFKKTTIQPDAYGIVFSIQPWNFPYWQAFRMAACAWMAGNLVALKHSDEVAGCADLIEQMSEVDGIKYLLNIRVSHDDAAEIMKSNRIQMVTFTGSTKGGRTVAQTAGGALKKCVLELGGSDAYIVMPDCDLELAAKTCVQARLVNSGQSCIAGKRFFIHESLFNEFKKRFMQYLSEQKVGDPEKPETTVGPLAAVRFKKALEDQVSRAIISGASLEWTQFDLPKVGCFTQLGILDFGSNLKAFETEEVFAPVASLYQFKNVMDVIDVINHGPYGLGGGLFAKDQKLIDEISKKIQVGTFAVNSFVQSDARVPFGGFRESGLSREMGLEGLHDFVAWKVVGQA
jgi:succinate-semialdehyde dehydrogenase/glutarate-semialdehyde dehydrogenase